MKSRIIKSIISLIFLVLSLYLIAVINDLNVLPNKYFILLIGIIFIFNIIADICLFGKSKILKIVSSIFYGILLIIIILGIKYGNDTITFLNKSFNNHTYEINTYLVLTIKDSNINRIEDLKDKEIYYLDTDNYKDEVIQKVNSLVKVNLIGKGDIYSLYDILINGDALSIVIDSAYLDVLSDDLSVDEQIKTIYSFEIKHEKENKSEQIKKLKAMNIYISGSDSRSDVIYNKSRSDVNMILTINPDTNTILMTSIPRDYYVDVYGKTGLKDKLTHAGIYGVDTSKKTLENLFDIKIDYSIKVNFNSVVELVDLVGGIDVYSDITFDSSHIPGWIVEKGINHMDGRKALAYTRERYAYTSGDNHRIMNQQQVLEATMTKIISDEKILLKYDKLLDSFSKFYVTDIPKSVVTLFVKDQLNDMELWKFESQRVTGTGDSRNTYTAPTLKRYVMIPDEKSVINAKNKINEILEG